MAANMLPILAVAGAFFLLSKKKGNGSGNANGANGNGGNGANGNGGNGNGGNGNGGDEPDGPGGMPPDWSKPTPAGDMKWSTSYAIGLRMGTGGVIDQVTLVGPDDSDPDTDLLLKDGVGHESLTIRILKPSTWTVTLSGTAGDTQEPLTRTWKLESYDVT